jgi:hypothetical protein
MITQIEDHLELLLETAQIAASRRLEIAIGRGAIPREGDLQRLQRYELANDRELSRMIEQLHRLQERRQKGCNDRGQTTASHQGE